MDTDKLIKRQKELENEFDELVKKRSRLISAKKQVESEMSEHTGAYNEITKLLSEPKDEVKNENPA